jgi:hypothetical protein
MALIGDKQYDPSHTIPELIDESIADLLDSAKKGCADDLNTLCSAKELLYHLNDQFLMLFDDEIPGYTLSIQGEKAYNGAQELYLSVAPSIYESRLELVFSRAVQIFRMRIGLLTTTPYERKKRFYRVFPAGDSPAAKVSVNRLLPYIQQRTLQDIQGDLGKFSVLTNYLSGLSLKHQTALSQCTEGLFGKSGSNEYGASATQVLDPEWRSEVCQELAEIRVATAYLPLSTP